MIVKIYKNVDTSVTTWDTSVGIYATSYSTLKTYPSDSNLIYKKNFTRNLELNESYTLPTRQDNIRNLYIEFSDPTFVYEIQFSVGSLAYIKSDIGEINLGNNKTISIDTKYQIVNSNTFVITIPINKPTNRILVYESATNKLIHITDWIAKETTQNVTINYTNNNGVLNVTSSVTPVNPLPVPNFNVQKESLYLQDNSLKNYANMDYENSSYSELYYKPRCPGSWIIRQNDISCPIGQILNNTATECSNIYSKSIMPIKSINCDVNNGSEPQLLSTNINSASINCNEGVIVSYMRRGWGNLKAIPRTGRCESPEYFNNRYFKTKCASLSIPKD
jgi:hypothetical protein